MRAPPSSGSSLPASMRMNVVLPVPFSPSMTTISLSVNEPASMFSSKSPARVQANAIELNVVRSILMVKLRCIREHLSCLVNENIA